MLKAKCTNYNNCEKADSNEIFNVMPGTDQKCPSCGSDVLILTEPKKGINPIIILSIVALIIITIAGFLTYKTLSNIKAKRNEAKIDNPVTLNLNTTQQAHKTTTEQEVKPIQLQTPPLEQNPELKKEFLFTISTNNSSLSSQLIQPILIKFIQKEFNIDSNQIKITDSNNEITIQALKPLEKIEFHAKIIIDSISNQLNLLSEKKIDAVISYNTFKNKNTQNINQEIIQQVEENIIALDAIAIITNKNNPINKLSLDEIKGIFSGEITNWSNLGGVNAEIIPLSLDKTSYTFNLFNNITKLDKIASNLKFINNNSELLKTISENTYAVTFIRANEISNFNQFNIIEVYNGKSISLKPTKLNIKTEDYLFTQRIYIYSTYNSSNKYLQKFIDYILTNEAQDLVDNTGFIGQTVNPIVVNFNDQPLEKRSPDSRYLEITKNASQVPFNVRFTEKGELDKKAQNDLKRFIDLLNKPEYNSKKIILLGFTDDMGSSHQNILQSHEKAQLVKDFLSKYNLKVSELYGLGELFPIDSYLTVENRNKNKRVEIWVKD